MKIWKPITKYSKFRDEFAYHTDFSLSAGETLSFFAGGNGESVRIYEECPTGHVWKIHLEIAIEPFLVDESESD